MLNALKGEHKKNYIITYKWKMYDKRFHKKETSDPSQSQSIHVSFLSMF